MFSICDAVTYNSAFGPQLKMSGQSKRLSAISGSYCCVSIADDFYKHALASPAVEFAVKDLLPRAEIEFAFGDGDDDFATHDLAFEMGVGVIFAGAIVTISGGRLVWREFLQPYFVITVQSGFI